VALTRSQKANQTFQITVYKGLKESGARPGQTVAIVGAGGGLGSLAQQYARAMGLKVIAIDSGDEKREMSKNMGASVSPPRVNPNHAIDESVGIH
jgi:D-arabinose 1-dehydrogenase-like Zn-dependent alcohol dehydrogenase